MEQDFMIIVWILIFTFSACIVIVVFARLFPNEPKKTVAENNKDVKKVVEKEEYRVPISELKNYKQLYKIGDDVIDRITYCILKGEEFVTLSKEEYGFLQSLEEDAKKEENAQKELDEWNKKHRLICDTRLKAFELEKSGHIQEAIDTYIANIKQCNSDPRFDYYQYTGYDINRVIILLSKTKQYDLLRQMLEFNINKYPDCASDWKFRLEKLNNPKPYTIIPELEDIDRIIESNKENSIGKQIQKYKLSLPEFDFYCDLPEGIPTNLYEKLPNTLEIGRRLMEYRDALRFIKHEAYIAEQTGDYKTAIIAYERIVKEECEDTFPYERLMILYKKIGWKDYEKSVIKRGILFFSNLRETQKEYVIGLARKYGMEHKALEYINSNKKIFYYMGAFELYNPYPIMKKWENRLNKL